MERLLKRIYSPEFWEQAVRLHEVDKLTLAEQKSASAGEGEAASQTIPEFDFR